MWQLLPMQALKLSSDQNITHLYTLHNTEKLHVCNTGVCSAAETEFIVSFLHNLENNFETGF